MSDISGGIEALTLPVTLEGSCAGCAITVATLPTLLPFAERCLTRRTPVFRYTASNVLPEGVQDVRLSGAGCSCSPHCDHDGDGCASQDPARR